MIAEGIGGLPEVDVDPLGDLMLDFLIDRDKEEPFLDFKETLSVAKDSPFAKIAKDILAVSNYGGGFVLVGFREKVAGEEDAKATNKRNFIPEGLPDGVFYFLCTLGRIPPASAGVFPFNPARL